MYFIKHLPLSSIVLIEKLIKDIEVNIEVVSSRKTKLGDFRVIDNYYFITVNNDLNQYSFLLTLLHELAHAFTFDKFKSSVLPHGVEWKNIFKSIMKPFINSKIFPNDIAQVLINHMRNPKASSCSDMYLMKVLFKYDNTKHLFLEDIKMGSTFVFRKERFFVKIEKIRKRYKCQELNTKKIYLFSPLATVSLTN